MRALILIVAMCAALTGCKKDNKAAGSETTGSAAATGGAAAGGSAGMNAEKALEAAGSAMEAAGKAAGSAAEAAGMAGSAAAAAEAAAAAGANAAATAAAMSANVPRPASVTDAQVALADKLVVVMQKMGTNIAAAGTDCKKAAEAVKAGAKDLEPMKAEIDKWEKLSKDDEKVKAWFQANYMSKMMTAMGPMMSLAQTCGKDAGFQEAMKNLDM